MSVCVRAAENVSCPPHGHELSASLPSNTLGGDSQRHGQTITKEGGAGSLTTHMPTPPTQA